MADHAPDTDIPRIAISGWTKTLQAFAAKISRFPAAMPTMLCAFSDSLTPPRQIVIAGDPARSDTRAMLREVNQHYLPNTVILLADGGNRQKEMAGMLPFLEGIKPLRGRATAYVCQNYVCQAPTTDFAACRKILRAPPETL
ncbi:MAG: hypothetical protein HY360_22760 [Verrucomicrobia bacterium]|nr:hypothetical protein [Verrucomicrobiota bacterium]